MGRGGGAEWTIDVTPPEGVPVGTLLIAYIDHADAIHSTERRSKSLIGQDGLPG